VKENPHVEVDIEDRMMSGTSIAFLKNMMKKRSLK
jgi:hypothetical protein